MRRPLGRAFVVGGGAASVSHSEKMEVPKIELMDPKKFVISIHWTFQMDQMTPSAMASIGHGTLQ